MTLIAQYLLWLHIGIGGLALVIGAGALLSRKGGRIHRKLGRLFIWLMGAVVGSAAVLLFFRFNPFLAGLTVFSGYMAFSGVRVLHRKRPDAGQCCTALDWLASVAAIFCASGLALVVCLKLVPQSPAVILSTAGGTLLYASYDLWRFAKPLAWPFSPHLWVYEHILKMLGAFTSVVAAFSGSVLTLFQPPWRQLWPTLVFTPISIAMVIYFSRKLRTTPNRLDLDTPERRQKTLVRK